MEIWSSTQNTTEVQAYAAQATGVDNNKIVCKVKRLGGGFGGKETRSMQLSTICAVAANKAKKTCSMHAQSRRGHHDIRTATSVPYCVEDRSQ